MVAAKGPSNRVQCQGSALTDCKAAHATRGSTRAMCGQGVGVHARKAIGQWNFAIPFHLKAYLDHITQPHSAFDPATYQGLLKGKLALVVVATAGGSVFNGPLAS